MSLQVQNHVLSPVSNWGDYHSKEGVNDNLTFDFDHVSLDLSQWIYKGEKRGIDVKDLLDKLHELEENKPEPSQMKLDFSREIVYIYQNKMRRYLLCEMIRRCMLNFINNLYEEGQAHLAENPNKLSTVHQCYRFLMKQVPEKVTLLLKPSEYPEKVGNMMHQYKYIKNEGMKMKRKLA